MTQSSSPPSRERGRPRAAHVETVAEIAFGIFRDRGFAETTMEEIAREAGIAPATLYRYVASKAELFWWGYAQNKTVFANELAARPSRENDTEVAFRAYRAMLTDAGEAMSRIRDRIALVTSEHPDGLGTWDHYTAWLDVLAAEFARRHGLPSADLRTRVRAATLWAAIWSAMTMWAQGEDSTPDAYLRVAEAELSGTG